MRLADLDTTAMIAPIEGKTHENTRWGADWRYFGQYLPVLRASSPHRPITVRQDGGLRWNSASVRHIFSIIVFEQD
jgi:hypothetical protein